MTQHCIKPIKLFDFLQMTKNIRPVGTSTEAWFFYHTIIRCMPVYARVYGRQICIGKVDKKMLINEIKARKKRTYSPDDILATLTSNLSIDPCDPLGLKHMYIPLMFETLYSPINHYPINDQKFNRLYLSDQILEFDNNSIKKIKYFDIKEKDGQIIYKRIDSEIDVTKEDLYIDGVYFNASEQESESDRSERKPINANLLASNLLCDLRNIKNSTAARTKKMSDSIKIVIKHLKKYDPNFDEFSMPGNPQDFFDFCMELNKQRMGSFFCGDKNTFTDKYCSGKYNNGVKICSWGKGKKENKDYWQGKYSTFLLNCI
jgi:hypothetical protein